MSSLYMLIYLCTSPACAPAQKYSGGYILNMNQQDCEEASRLAYRSGHSTFPGLNSSIFGEAFCVQQNGVPFRIDDLWTIRPPNGAYDGALPEANFRVKK